MSIICNKMSLKSHSIATGLLLFGCLTIPAGALSPNPILSQGKTVYASGGNAPYLVDGKFQGQAFTISDGAWIAIKVGPGPSRLFVAWNDPVDAWSNEMTTPGCPKSNPMPVDYDLLTSANSTNGSDGTWSTAASITGNIVTARGHLIPFDGAAWVKLAIKKGDGTLDELEAFDASGGADDSWFFAGTSITQMTFKENAVVPNFADRVASAHPGFHPAVVRGGIGCIRSDDMLRNLPKYLKAARSAHFWAIEMGTNDGWNNGSVNVPSFKRNMQTIIDSCKAAGIVPIIAHPLATNPAKTGGWQLSEEYVKTVDSLAAKNRLPAGPDFYGYFKAHPDELRGDGVHPTPTGAASIQRMWAETATAAYATTGFARRPGFLLSEEGARALSLRAAGGRLDLRADAAGTAYLYGPRGRLLDRIRFEGPGEAVRPLPAGFAIVRFHTARGIETVPVPVR